MKNLVNFTVGNEGDKLVTDYTFERTDTRLVITEAEVAPKRGDSKTTTVTKIVDWDKTSIEVSVGKLRKSAKVVLAILVILVGAAIIGASFLKDMVCVGVLAAVAEAYPWVCYFVGGFVVIAGICWLITGILRRKKAAFTEILVKSNGEVVESLKFNDTPEGEIASNLIEFFRG